ncbi:DUF1707 domain-containing protein [Nonomuraea sp. NPDC049152]|uniref:DUF1707 SHOCT-like domain-containing protein n=1 Tax=Nonomuraea sp. NPDC049152 TaxID=3154350 RepID=UPI0033CD751F
MSTDDQLRIGDAERDETMEALREHFAQGRLTREELDERLDLALSARTVGDLSRVHVDLPSPGRHPVAAYDADRRGPGRHPDPAEFGYGWPMGPEGYGPNWAMAHPKHQRHLRRVHAHRMRHMRQAHMRAHRHHRGPGPLAPILLVALVIGLAVGGFTVLKVLFFVWVAAMVFGFAHRRFHARRLGP